MTDFGDTTTHGLFEMINVDTTHGVILSGISSMPGCGLTCKMSHKKLEFKSGGNTAGGQAVVVTMSIASLSASTAPTIADVKTTKTYANHHIAKTVSSLISRSSLIHLSFISQPPILSSSCLVTAGSFRERHKGGSAAVA